MEGAKCPPVTVEGDWSPAQNKSVRNKLQVYFQSKKKSSGGECRVEVEDGAPRAAIYFSSEDVRQSVLARTGHEIIVENRTVRLHLTSASGSRRSDGISDSEPVTTETEPGYELSSESKKECVHSVTVVLDNITDNMSRDVLSMLVENISGLDYRDYTLEIIWDTNTAVITFDSPAALKTFLTLSESSQKLQKHGLTAQPLEAAKSIRVEELPTAVIKDMLELYFEKDWATPDSVTMIPDQQAAIVTFSDSKVVRTICTKHDYMMRSIPIKVYPYYESLGTALYGNDRPDWKLPDPFTEKVHHVVWKFLQKQNLWGQINHHMRPYFCSVDLENPEVKLSPLPSFLRQKGLTEKQVDAWMSAALEAFLQHMSQYSAFECAVNAPAWKAAEKDVQSVVREDGVLVVDESRETLTVAGRADSMKLIRTPVENIVLKAVSQIKRQTEGVSEEMTVSPAVVYILKQEGLHKAVQDISPDMNLSYDEATQKLTLAGLPAEVLQTKAWILENSVDLSKYQLDLPAHLQYFVKTEDPMDMSPEQLSQESNCDSAISESESIESIAVLLDNTVDSISRDVLLLLVERISGLDESSFSLEVIRETNRAVVTFTSPADVEKFLAMSQSNRFMQEHGLTAQPLEAAKSIRVESLSPTVLPDMLELYFDKYCAVPDNITMLPHEQAAIVTFSDPKVVRSFCAKQDYMMRSIPIKVYPYYESLGTALYGNDRPDWKLPDPFTEKVHHVVWKFLQKQNLWGQINHHMRPYFCSVDLENPEVKLSPLPSFLRQKGLTEKQVDAWMSAALEAFRQHMSQYSAFECAVNAPAWKAAEKDVQSVVREDGVLVVDESRETLTVAGRADSMKLIRTPVENIVLKAVSQIKRQTEGVSEEMTLSSAKFFILMQEGLHKALQDISPRMNLSYDEATQKLTLAGLPAEVLQTKAWILGKNVDLRTKHISVSQ